jgi:acetyl esterase/lipase
LHLRYYRNLERAPFVEIKHKVSFSAGLLILILRFFLRPRIKAGLPVKKVRKRLETVDRWAGYFSQRFIIRKHPLGELPGYWVRVPGSIDDRILLHLHGGGFCFSTPMLHSSMIARWLSTINAVGVLPEYRLAPENPYPAAVEDCLMSYQALLDQGYFHENIVLSGDSAGGTLALVLLQMAKQRGLPLPSCSILLSPGTDATIQRGSRLANSSRDPVGCLSYLQEIVQLYVSKTKIDLRDPGISPLYGKFAGLPPLLIMVGSTEILLDDSVFVARRAHSAGVNVTLQLWKNMPHVFPGMQFLPESHMAQIEISEFINKHIG